MATKKVYITNSTTPYTPSTKHGAWDDSTASVIQKLDSVPSGGAATSAVAETNVSTTWDVFLGRWVSDGLQSAYEFTKSGNPIDTLSAIIGTLETTNGILKYHIHVWVTQGDSNTERGILLTDSIGATEWGTSAAGLTFSAANLTNVAALAGDRIVIEIGYQAQNALTTSITGTINYGNTGADLTNGDASVTTHAGNLTFTTNSAIDFAYTVNVNDAVTVSESVGFNIANPNKNDTVTVSEAVSLTQVYTLSVSDSITVTDSLVQYVDTIYVSESIGITIVLAKSVFDSVTVTDVPTVASSGGTVSVSVSDLVTVSEAITMLDRDFISVSDIITVADTPSQLEVTGRISVSDVITVTEGITISKVLSFSVFDSVTVNESTATLLVLLVINVSDIVTLTEDIVGIQLLALAVFDSISISESVSDSLIRTLNISDIISIYEAVDVSVSIIWHGRIPVADIWVDRTPIDI